MSLNYNQAVAELTSSGGFFETEPLHGDSLIRCYKNAAPHLRSVMESVSLGGGEALIYQDERYTWNDLLAGAMRLAAALANAGAVKSSRVAIAMRNLPEVAITFWACQQIGAVFIPLNAWWAGPELEFALTDCDPQLVILDGARLQRLSPDFISRMPVTVVTRLEADPPSGLVLWEDFLAGIGDAPPPRPEILPDDPATMLYTSGTTGKPKGAVSTHRNHISNILNTMFFGAIGRAMGASNTASPAPALASLSPMPMFHIGGLSAIYINAAFSSKLILMYRWDAETAIQLMERERVTTIALVPAMLRQILDSPSCKTADLSAMLGFAVGAASVDANLAKQAKAVFSPRVVSTTGYGLTETTSGVCANTGQTYAQKPDSVGPPFPVIDLRIVNDRHETVGPGENGEIWVRGPNVISAYWNRPNANAESFHDGWFRTGDIGRLDNEGFLFIADRLKDMIIRGGENVYSAEVEAALFEYPGIADVAVIGLPDPLLGERVAAVLIPKPGAGLHRSALLKFLESRLAKFKIPERYFQIDELPRNQTGKVIKKSLRETVLAEDFPEIPE